jgi:hypothetical protein
MQAALPNTFVLPPARIYEDPAMPCVVALRLAWHSTAASNPQ